MSDAPVEESWADHVGPLRTLGRVAWGAAIRFLAGGVVFGLVCAGGALAGRNVEQRPWFWWGGRSRNFGDALTDELALAGFLALGAAALRALEELERVVKPDASYPRKLAMGAIVAVASVVVVYGLLLQLEYASGLVSSGGAIGGGLGEIATRRSVLGRRDAKELLGIALAFGITGFGRARRLPLWEQVALLAPFGFFYVSEKLVYEGTLVVGGNTWGHAYELGLWVTAWISALLLPVVARLGDGLERRFLPKRLAPRPAPA